MIDLLMKQVLVSMCRKLSSSAAKMIISVVILYVCICHSSATRPHGLTFAWWGCCGLCFWNKPTELAHCFFGSVFVSISVFMALSTVFHSINSPDNSPLSHSVLPVLFPPCWSFERYISFWKSPSALSPDIILCGWLGSKHQLTKNPSALI